MSLRCFVGLDVGTSSTKAVLVAAETGEVLRTVTRSHEVRRGAAGLVEMDQEIWWDEFRSIYPELTAAVEGVEPGIAGIGVSGMGPCVAVTDADDHPIAPSALYGVDARAREQIDALAARFGQDELLSRYDSQLTTQAGGPKLVWFAEHHPEAFAEPTRLYMPSSALIRKLTGEYVLDRQSASQCTPLYDPETCEWDEKMWRALSPGTIPPRLGWSDEICGHTRTREDLPELAAAIPVTFGTVDAWAEQESVGAVADHELFLMYGTTLFLVANSTRRARHPAMWGTTGTRAGMRNLAGGLATSGSLTDWMRRITGEDDYSVLTAEAAEVAPGCDGLMVLPYFAGERTPVQDPDARGIIAGLTLDHTRAHLYRAMLEGTALAVRHNIEVMEAAGLRIDTIACAGGGVTSDLWPQIVSDVTGRAQVRRRHHVGAALGDAFLVARALGEVESIDPWNPVEYVFEPQTTDAVDYDRRYADYRALYESTTEIAHHLAADGETAGGGED